jgi:hypothetical protein
VIGGSLLFSLERVDTLPFNILRVAKKNSFFRVLRCNSRFFPERQGEYYKKLGFRSCKEAPKRGLGYKKSLAWPPPIGK